MTVLLHGDTPSGTEDGPVVARFRIAWMESVPHALKRCAVIISLGCGSFRVSWLRCEGEAFAVAGSVDAFVFPAQVVAPVGFEVAVGGEGAEPEDGLGAGESPSCACYVHSVLYDVPAGTLDDPGGDGPAFLECGGVIRCGALAVR